MHAPALHRWLAAALLVSAASWAGAAEILFIGNSFTQGVGSPVQAWGADSVNDLERRGIGGVPALVQALLRQIGATHRVSLSTEGGQGLDWHLEHRGDALAARDWDVVVMHGYSTLDAQHPGDGTLLRHSTAALAERLRRGSPRARIWLMATWPRADQVLPASGHWHGRGMEAMARDLRAAYDAAAQASPHIAGVIPVGEAWARAMRSGVADANPYDGLATGQLDLWSDDHYHASAAGSYLQALVVFGRLSGEDPLRRWPDDEPVARALGLSAPAARALRQVASEELAAADR